jgi:hypothetical protein
MDKLFTVLLALGYVLGGIEILQPESLRNKIRNDGEEPGSLVYTISTFGHILYSESVNVQVLSPGDHNLNGCDAFVHPSGLSAKKFVWLVERGVCTFSKKAFLAQQSGAFAVLAYHDNPDADIKNIIPCGDKTCRVNRQKSEDPDYSHR